jgi:hypothetical protein
MLGDAAAEARLHDQHCGQHRPVALRQPEQLGDRKGRQPGDRDGQAQLDFERYRAR